MSYLYVELCVAQVGVVCEGLVDECGQLRVGKYVFPQKIAECRAVGGLLTGLYIRLCESRVGRRLVFLYMWQLDIVATATTAMRMRAILLIFI